MGKAAQRQTGLGLGLISLGLVAVGFLAVFVLGPGAQTGVPSSEVSADAPGLLDRLDDAPTRRAVEALKRTAPATYAELDVAARHAIAEGESESRLAQLVLEALFAQFQIQAPAIKSARSDQFQTIVTGFASGLRALQAANSDWCEGPHIAAYLAQNETDLVPALLAEFPYASPQYDWAMDWMVTILSVARTAQDTPQRHARPTARDEAILQQYGLELGAQQWNLALQVAAFANSEGVSYARMQEVIAGMDACALGIAAESVSARLPGDVRARIWSDLMPEIMIGNTPYVMWRVTDYFFIG